ncbi:UNVERIFIED_CONTAM: Serine/threonine-protein kinase 16 [Siphonaria sp. JEL0065]|nr:Serine/threonine-protein kinase 16 [Siphonaria sp. JEL0065]
MVMALDHNILISTSEYDMFLKVFRGCLSARNSKTFTESYAENHSQLGRIGGSEGYGVNRQFNNSNGNINVIAATPTRTKNPGPFGNNPFSSTQLAPINVTPIRLAVSFNAAGPPARFGAGAAAAAIGQHYSKSPLANITSIDSVSSLYSLPKVGSPVSSLTTVATQDTSGAGISSGSNNSITGVANNGGNIFSSGKRFLEPESAADQHPFHKKAFRGGSLRNTISCVQDKLLDYFEIIAAFFASLLAGFAKAKEFRIKNRRFIVLRPLGEGGFSYVYLVKEKTPGIHPTNAEMYALKKIRVQLPEQEQRLRAEISAHCAVNSPHVLKLLDSVILRGQDVCARAHGQSAMELPVLAEGLLLLPYFGGGTVQDLIDSIAPGDSLSLSYPNSKKNPPLAFRDLKPANILLSLPPNEKAILMDLGSVTPARVRLTTRREAVALQELCAETVTAPFRAPELFDPNSDAVIDERSDVWAFGCTLWAMAYQHPPFDGSMTAAVGGQLIFPPQGAYGPQFRLLLTDILVTDPRQRLQMGQVLIRIENLLGSLSST